MGTPVVRLEGQRELGDQRQRSFKDKGRSPSSTQKPKGPPGLRWCSGTCYRRGSRFKEQMSVTHQAAPPNSTPQCSSGPEEVEEMSEVQA